MWCWRGNGGDDDNDDDEKRTTIIRERVKTNKLGTDGHKDDEEFC